MTMRLFFLPSLDAFPMAKDYSIWKLNARDILLYYHLPKRNDMCMDFPLKQILKVKASPRVGFFTWNTARECILTIDKLIKRHKILVNGCFLCKRDA